MLNQMIPLEEEELFFRRSFWNLKRTFTLLKCCYLLLKFRRKFWNLKRTVLLWSSLWPPLSRSHFPFSNPYSFFSVSKSSPTLNFEETQFRQENWQRQRNSRWRRLQRNCPIWCGRSRLPGCRTRMILNKWITPYIRSVRPLRRLVR